MMSSNKHTFNIAPGSKVEDKITGFKGVVTSCCNYITGCDRYGVAPIELQKGIPGDSVFIDEYRLIESKKIKPEVENFMFSNGDTLKDLITGFEGICVARTSYPASSNRYSLVLKDPKNLKDDREWLHFDEDQLELVSKSTVKLVTRDLSVNKEQKQKPGGRPNVETPSR